ncbi:MULTISPECIES: flagellar hook assembly protein FlgD [Asaia]|uniref:Basal-body rod modification protein FlgD n=2 Tax=Asaia TaxID=91914 RepID=A0ABQ1L772_9PROT|nr:MULTISPECIES: flagellar hook capping FlgD N-terminal domain-containing protein [Asaia]GBR09804.1 basal-body rod modification protein FlgD [Asaia siamensis NRIC 0323]GBR20722.1 basal-body rod modification protein FlgD [Asaia spathodeae NBRC 105894]GGC18957.1 flagellar hook assembly protein [Asaia siamensis]
MDTSTISNDTKLLQAAEATAKASANSSSSGSTSDSTSTASLGLSSLANNYTTFLTLLTTQLQHQDPSSPMSSDSFTSELVQFAGTEQQVQTNAKLSSLISLNESSQLSSGSQWIGQTATATSTTLPLQNSKASLTFSATQGQDVAIAISDSSGKIVKTQSGAAASSTNTWTWDGTDNSGNQLADGAYSVSVKTIDSTGATSDLPFTIKGTVTGVHKGSSELEVEMGRASIPLSSITNFSAATTSGSSNGGSATAES